VRVQIPTSFGLRELTERRCNLTLKARRKEIRRQATCFFCGKHKGIQKHHTIPVGIGGSGMPNNTAWLCSSCHRKLHLLLDPVIEYMRNKQQ